MQPCLLCLIKIEPFGGGSHSTKERKQVGIVSFISKDDPLYIRPIDEADVFDGNKVSELTKLSVLLILVDGDKDIGRIAAFVNGKIWNAEDQPTGGCGFFDLLMFSKQQVSF